MIGDAACAAEPVIAGEGEAALASQLPQADVALGPAYPPLIDNTELLMEAADRLAIALPPVDPYAASIQETPSQPEGESVPPPVILSFTGQSQGGYWLFQGTVDHDDPDSLTIEFGGLLAGHSTPVDALGKFYYQHTFAPGTNGSVTAQAFTLGGQSSNIESTYVG